MFGNEILDDDPKDDDAEEDSAKESSPPKNIRRKIPPKKTTAMKKSVVVKKKVVKVTRKQIAPKRFVSRDVIEVVDVGPIHHTQGQLAKAAAKAKKIQ